MEKKEKMYMKDKTKSVQIRLSPTQYEFIKKDAKTFGVTPSNYIRMLINAMMSTQKKVDGIIKGVNDAYNQANKHN